MWKRFCVIVAPDWQDRADLVQEVWIRVYRNIPRLTEPGKFPGWLSRITTNLFYDELRKRKRMAPLLSLDAPMMVEDGELEWELAAATPEPDDGAETAGVLWSTANSDRRTT
ncbi:sigma factor [Kovacikia minuta]|uniref:sigma factor n=1 Tax=Kovacikia minuta TaxID=2931930 RepID=UPI0020C82626